MKKDNVVYLYGITESRPQSVPAMTGVERFAKIEAVECDGIFCWISRVSARDFEENLAQNLENLDWLAEVSVAHQRVIGAIAREIEILPARLATVFRSEASLCSHARKWVKSFKRDFARIRAADEWGIKVFELERRPRLPEIRSGKDYLKAKAALLPARRGPSDGRNEISRFEGALKQIAADTAHAGNVSRGQRGLVFQTTLLVRRVNRQKLESLLHKFAQAWKAERRIECTGPWPPYSFVSRPEQRS